MTLSEHAEEILEALWIAVEEERALFLDPRQLEFPPNDPAYRELTDRAMIELRQGMVYTPIETMKSPTAKASVK